MGTGKGAGVSVDAWAREWAWAARARELCAHTVHAKCDTEVPLQHRERNDLGFERHHEGRGRTDDTRKDADSCLGLIRSGRTIGRRDERHYLILRYPREALQRADFG